MSPDLGGSATREDALGFALTASQRGLLAESLVAPDRGLNVEQVVWELDFVPNTEQFRAAWQHALDACDALRLGFEWPQSQREPVQTVHAKVALPFRVFDYATSKLDHQDELELFLERDRTVGFDLSSTPLMRVSLLIFGTQAACVWTIHHTIIDGGSYARVLQHVLARYSSVPGSDSVRTPQPARFSDFLGWLARHDVSAGIRHFQQLLEGVVDATPLPLQQDSPRQALRKTQRTLLRLDARATEELRAAAQASGGTPNTLVQLAWAVLLANYSNQMDVVFGTTWSGRPGTVERAGKIVGPFISTLPVRVNLQEARSVRELAGRLRDQHLAARPFIHTNTTEIKAHSALSHAPQLFETLVVFSRHSLQAELRDVDPRWRTQRLWSRSQTGYALVLAAAFDGDELELELEFDAGLYEANQAATLLGDYARLLQGLCSRLDASPFEVPLLDSGLLERLTTSQAERELVAQEPPAIARILEQARASHARLAIKHIDGPEVTYAELERRVLTLAALLRAKGATPGALVAVWLPRSIANVVALLAVHAAGCAFVPLDPTSPLSRIEQILDDSRAGWLLVGSETRDRVHRAHCLEIDVDGLDDQPAAVFEWTQPEPTSPAYVIYTSGSTGLPKGVVVPQSALANHLAAVLGLFRLDPSDRVLQFAPSTFDVALEEILPTLAAGATLLLRSDAMARSARDFFEALASHEVTVVNLPSAFWHQMVHAAHPVWPASVRLLVVGGERVSPESHARFRAENPTRPRWLNAYGPTEATITSTCYDDAEGDHGADGIPIGRPLSGVSHFVLDERMRPVPVGCTGQLFIGGVGLATGYLHRDELTSQSFVPHPFRPGARVYATGDRVRTTVRGNYVFVDRPDNQVKLRGFRIELGEIEAQLRRHPRVSEAVVILRDQGSAKALVGFVIADGSEVSEVDLREHLAEALPSHMLPAKLVILTSLPTTPSGKVDRRALADITLELPKPASTPPPSARHEAGSAASTLMDIWSELLSTPVTSTSASFFDLGGNSLLVVRMFSEIEQRLGRTCNVPAFFRNPTIAHLAQLLRSTQGRKPWSAMPLAPGTVRVRPLFFAPGLTGRAVDFVHLVRALSDDVPVYALQLHTFGASDLRDETLHEAVKGVVQAMRQVQPEGPYSLAGFSAGACFAVAIATELRAQGETTDFVGLIDGVPPATVPMASPLTSPRRLLRLSKTVLGRAQEILEQPGSLPSLWTRARAAAQRGLSRWHGDPTQHRLVIHELLGETSNFSARETATMQRYLDTLVNHRFDALSLDLVLFRTPLDPPEGPYEPDLGWSSVTTGRVTIEQLSGRHHDLMKATGCRELAQRFNAYLAQRHTPASTPTGN